MTANLTMDASGADRLFIARLGRRAVVSGLGLAMAALAGISFPAQGATTAQKVRLATSMGDIVIELNRDKAPKSVDNFIQYVKDGHYDGTIFHRVIDGFMIQGGGMVPDMTEKPTRPAIPLEAQNGLSNARGTVAMARTGMPDSATSQFFINVSDNARLDSAGGGYAVFGKVVEGMDVVDKIKGAATGRKGPHQNVPNEPILIKKATLEQA